jgi:hypothetical protein
MWTRFVAALLQAGRLAVNTPESENALALLISMNTISMFITISMFMLMNMLMVFLHVKFLHVEEHHVEGTPSAGRC